MTDETHSCKLCGWSDDQHKTELAMEWAGLWKRGERCRKTPPARKAVCDCGYNFVSHSRETCPHDGIHTACFHIDPHDIPCPDPLTDDAVAMRLLEAIAKRDHVCSIKITTYQGKWWVLIEDYGSKPRFEGIGDSLGLAIVRAAAAVAEQAKTLPQHG